MAFTDTDSVFPPVPVPKVGRLDLTGMPSTSLECIAPAERVQTLFAAPIIIPGTYLVAMTELEVVLARFGGFQIPNRAAGPDIDDIGHQVGPGCSALTVPMASVP
jgi:hypothetical protein